MIKTSKLLDARGKPFQTVEAPRLPARQGVKARYDAATPSSETARHWALVDGMSAKAANSRSVRQRLRTRARYERDNNSYLDGMVSTLANDTIGTGPRLQLLLKDPILSRTIERSFADWCNCVDLAGKLRTMRESKAVDGEAFAIFISNPQLDHPVELDLKLIEGDQVVTPWLNPVDPLAVDGIRYDVYGNPIEYSLLRYHPGDTYQVGYIADVIDARFMLHWYTVKRPGQCRGIPDIMPALPLSAQLRRYTLAVIAAAETAADLAAVVESQMAPEEGGDDFQPFDTLEIERRMMLTLPAGWKMNQFKPEQPATTYEMFKREILNEMARCISMPYNIAACNSSSYNYSSGRLDHQTYYKSLSVEQSQVETKLLDRILLAWIEEAWLATNLIPGGPSPLGGWPHQWFWDGHEHIDPYKEAMAQQVRIANHTTTLATEYAKRGQDWETQIRQRAKEVSLMAALGLNVYLPAGQVGTPDTQVADVGYEPDPDDSEPDGGDDS